MWLPLIGPLPKPDWFGDGAKLGYIIVVRLLEAVLANVLIWSGSVLYPDYGPGRARARDLAARRPGRGRQRDDDLDRHGHPRRCSRGCSSAPPTARPRTRSCSTSPTPTASSSTRRAPRAPSPPGRDSACVSASSPATAGSPAGSARAHEPQPLPRRPRLLRRSRHARRRDLGRPADGAVLRRLDDRLGEHDRRRPRRALGRLLVRRQARRPLPVGARALSRRDGRQRPLRDRPADRAAVLRRSRSAPSTRSRRAHSSARSSPSSSSSRSRSGSPAPARRGRSASPSPTSSPRARSPGASTRSRRSARSPGRCSRRSS